MLSATDALRRDRILASLDDNPINYSSSSIDWRQKYNEVADMLAETRAELDDFHHSSKDLEEELERELERTEKAQQELTLKVSRAESERDDWKSKFMSLQTTHNTTTTSLQRELDKLRQEHQAIKVQMRELEMGNDDLERNERVVASSLADIEAKYSRALEEKILLEHELLDKANLEEESQRLKDELRDANVEVAILKDQLAAAQAATPTTAPSSLFGRMSPAPSSDENLLATPPPPDLQLSELDDPVVTRVPRLSSSSRQGFHPQSSSTPGGSVPRSSTLPSLYSRMLPSRVPAIPRTESGLTQGTNGTIPTASRNKGVQMVSEMRARVKNLEQKIHTRVPRLRMGSASGRPSFGTPTSVANAMQDMIRPRKSVDSKMSDESGSSGKSKEKKKAPGTPMDTSGWVLIMEDSPSPVKSKLPERDKDKERRRTSSPLGGPTAYRPPSAASTNSINSMNTPPPGSYSLQNSTTSGTRKPLSRHSSASTASSSSIPTPGSTNSSRPQTPATSHVPSSLYSSTSTVAGSGIKRSVTMQAKRNSMGSSVATERGTTPRSGSMLPPPPPRPSLTPTSIANHSSTSLTSPSPTASGYSSDRDRALPHLPASLSTNVTMRPPSKLPASLSSSLSQSRIGRLSAGGPVGRGTADLLSLGLSDTEKDPKDDKKPPPLARSRSGTTSSVFGFGASRNGH